MLKLRLKRVEPPVQEASAPQVFTGVLAEWNDERGYGFITPDDGGQRVFLHIKSLKPEARRPIKGEFFFYKLATDERGRPRAEDAFQTILDEKRSLPFIHSILKALSYCWPLAIMPSFALTAKSGSLAYGLCASFIVNSLLTVLFYWEDKHLARYKYWRIPEKCLHVWEILCGWPGAMFAQQAFRHKRSKTSFMVIFWLCAAANAIAMFLLFYYADHKAIGKAIEKLWHEIVSAYA